MVVKHCPFRKLFDVWLWLATPHLTLISITSPVLVPAGPAPTYPEASHPSALTSRTVTEVMTPTSGPEKENVSARARSKLRLESEYSHCSGASPFSPVLARESREPMS